jgi:small neutral amino acid transporter SnatA (MarC family)
VSEYLQLLAAFFAAINPAGVAATFSQAVRRENPGVLEGRERQAAVALGLAVAAAAYVVLGLAGDSLLDALDIAPETFRIAAGTVMAVAGGFAIWRLGFAQDGAMPGVLAGLFPLALPLLASAAGLMAVVSYAADDGAGVAIGAVLPIATLAAAAAYAYQDRWASAAGAIARLTGALLIAVAAGLVVEGIRDI